jgi:hypothetical protein
MAPNPTGIVGAGGTQPVSNPILYNPISTAPTGSAGNMGFGNTANPAPPMPPENINPYGSPTPGTPPPSDSTFPMPSAGVSMTPPGAPGGSTNPVTGQSGQVVTDPNTFGQTGRQQDRTLQELQKYYGEGMGSMLYQYLQSGGGFNSALTTQAVDAQTAAMQHDIQMGFNTLGTNLAESGISPNSSVAALEKSNYMSQAVTQENAIAAQEYYNMWNQSQNRELEMLGEVGRVNATGTANQPSFWSTAGNILGLGQTGLDLFSSIKGLLPSGGGSSSGGGDYSTGGSSAGA